MLTVTSPDLLVASSRSPTTDRLSGHRTPYMTPQAACDYRDAVSLNLTNAKKHAAWFRYDFEFIIMDP